MSEDKLRCKFCSFETLKFHTSSIGRPISGFTLIKEHIEQQHSSEFKNIYVGEAYKS